MSDLTENFWPVEPPSLDDPEPVRLLKQQAELLRSLHGGQIEGFVKMSTEEGTAYHSLYLKAEALGHYSYKLLYIAYPAVRPTESVYPIQAQTSAGEHSAKLADDGEFRGWLRSQLSSDFVKRAISNLLRYIRDRQNSARTG